MDHDETTGKPDRLSTNPDEADVRAAVEGDLEAYGRIVERYQDVALRAAWLIVRDQAAAQDVCQEAFLRAHRGLSGFRAAEPLRPWLLQIVRNQAKNHLRAHGRREGMLARVLRLRGEVAPSPARAVEEGETRDDVLAAVARLDSGDRDVIHLRYYLDLSEAEMAATLSIPPGTVKSRLTRARRHLREVIESDFPDLRSGLAGAVTTESEGDARA